MHLDGLPNMRCRLCGVLWRSSCDLFTTLFLFLRWNSICDSRPRLAQCKFAQTGVGVLR